MMNMWYNGAWNGNYLPFGIGPTTIAIGILILIVVLALKGYALWTAAKRNEPWWFVIMLVVNTIGILELVYIIFVAKKWPKRA